MTALVTTVLVVLTAMPLGAPSDVAWRSSEAPGFVLPEGTVSAELGVLAVPLPSGRGTMAAGLPLRFELAASYDALLGASARLRWAPFPWGALPGNPTVGVEGLLTSFGSIDRWHGFVGPELTLTGWSFDRLYWSAGGQLLQRLDETVPNDFGSSAWIIGVRALALVQLTDGFSLGVAASALRGSAIVREPLTFETALSYLPVGVDLHFRTVDLFVDVVVGVAEVENPDENGHMTTRLLPVASVRMCPVFTVDESRP